MIYWTVLLYTVKVTTVLFVTANCTVQIAYFTVCNSNRVLYTVLYVTVTVYCTHNGYCTVKYSPCNVTILYTVTVLLDTVKVTVYVYYKGYCNDILYYAIGNLYTVLYCTVLLPCYCIL